MTLENQYQLSFYKECAKIGERDDIHLVQHTENHMFYVKKELTVYNIDVYRRISEGRTEEISRLGTDEEFYQQELQKYLEKNK